MLLTVLSVIIFFVTLPIKAVKLGVDTSRGASALKDRLHSTLYENRREKTPEEKLSNINQTAKRAGKIAVRLVKKSIIMFLRLVRIVATILSTIGVLWSVVLVMAVLLLLSTAGYMLTMQQAGVEVSNLTANNSSVTDEVIDTTENLSDFSEDDFIQVPAKESNISVNPQQKVEWIVIHQPGVHPNPQWAKNTAAYFQGDPDQGQASAHFTVDEVGIYQCVPLDKCALAVGDSKANNTETEHYKKMIEQLNLYKF